MSRIIIGIHGLGNKPPQKLLKKWWKKSIREGLTIIGQPKMFLKFELVYWADILYPTPLSPRVKDKKSPSYLNDPYLPAQNLVPKKTNKFKQMALDYLRDQLDRIFLNDDLSLNFSFLTDLIIHQYFRDLEIYFSTKCLDQTRSPCLARDLIRERLVRCLEKYRRHEILLIAHSMGSIIAYDVLRFTPHVKADILVTIGSPLGLPVVISKIVSEQHSSLTKENVVQIPENVLKAWYNFSDLDDKVAFDYRLAGDFKPNVRGVQVTDQIVYNNYEINGHRNPHKSYGYLRSPEVAKAIHDFLLPPKRYWWQKIPALWKKFFRSRT